MVLQEPVRERHIAEAWVVTPAPMRFDQAPGIEHQIERTTGGPAAKSRYALERVHQPGVAAPEDLGHAAHRRLVPAERLAGRSLGHGARV